MSVIRQFYALVYKADNAFYKNGQQVAIFCNHVWEGTMGLNTVGEIVPLPDATTTSPLADTAMVEHGTVFPSPTYFGDSGFKAVTQVKDIERLVTYWVDTASYNANVVTCNPTYP